ncbi:ABC transporter [Arthrobacter sp. MYb23]|uniref:ABC transporter permease n=1 Tax=Micrococcaceae TaxID=1268 RepID=UPI000CFB53D3|nr:MULTISPECIES: ABC transporter permease [Micrococcaceae]MCT9868274.1 ABC transporter permease [Paenarthrobacter aurescens]PRB43406.1 ABC transporter [Arthrobacter sp. MYb51]PRB96938.1 ABC transporter [Arthrobacter sp. MYb23]
MSVITAAVRDSSVIAHRNLLNVLRTPGALVTGIVQPVMFVLLLGFVFGGSLGGDQYRSFLIGGILAQTLTFNASFTAVYLAKDLQLGLIDRFRSLPMSRVAVILGRTTSDLYTSVISVAVTLLCGLAVGWRMNTGALELLAALGILLLFAFAVSWIGALIALTARSVEVAQSLGLVWLFPVTFVSGAFVSTASLPGPLRTIAEWNPVTSVATAVRELFGNNAPSGFIAPGGWPADNALLYAVMCSLVIIAVFAPLAIAKYRRISKL